MPHRTTLRKTKIDIDEFDAYQVKRSIIDGSPRRMETHAPGYFDLVGLITGRFVERQHLQFCRPDDEESQRALWEIFRDDILKAQNYFAPDEKPWACRFDTEKKIV
jgi:hypothetical protein